MVIPKPHSSYSPRKNRFSQSLCTYAYYPSDMLITNQPVILLHKAIMSTFHPVQQKQENWPESLWHLTVTPKCVSSPKIWTHNKSLCKAWAPWWHGRQDGVEWEHMWVWWSDVHKPLPGYDYGAWYKNLKTKIPSRLPLFQPRTTRRSEWSRTTDASAKPAGRYMQSVWHMNHSEVPHSRLLSSGHSYYQLNQYTSLLMAHFTSQYPTATKPARWNNYRHNSGF